MPELPEVETVRRGLAPVMEGVRIARLVQRRADLRFPFPERFAERVEGRRVLAVGRRAKYLIAEIEGGDTLVMHLGMSGRFAISMAVSVAEGNGREGDAATARVAPPHPSPPPRKFGSPTARRGREPVPIGEYVHEAGGEAKHDHVTIHMESGTTITYNDARRFGFMLLIPTAELHGHALFADLGIEPLGNELSAAYLADLAKGRKTDLKAFLLDQKTIAGLGNIYVAEALFRARLNPRKPASVLARKNGTPTDHAVRLVPEIKAVLEAALQAGGSTLRDYRQADGERGSYQDRFAVYGREGEACPHTGCSGAIKRIVQAGRSTFFCPKCQR